MEIAFRGCLNSVRLGPVEALVEVELHDLVLAVGLSELVGEGELLDLAVDSLVRREELLLGELLRDRAATADDVAGAQVVEGRSDDAGEVEAGVRVEAPVLDRDRGLDHHGRDILQLHGKAVIAVVPDVGEQRSVAGGDDRVACEAGAVQALDRRKAVEEGLRVGVGGEADHQE